MLKQELLSLQQFRFTGKLAIANSANKWNVYFCLGRLIWCDGGEHPNRFWINNLNKYCPVPKFSEKNLNAALKYECWKYYLLKTLLEQEKITKTEFTKFIKKQTRGIFFDIIQAESEQNLKYITQEYSAESLIGRGLSIFSSVLNVEKRLESSQKEWNNWCEMGLKEISPNLAPSIAKLEELKERIPQAIYNNFTQTIDGKKTLRDLATKLDRDLIRLTRSLLSYIKEGSIALNKIDDLAVSKSASQLKTAIFTQSETSQTQALKRELAIRSRNSFLKRNCLSSNRAVPVSSNYVSSLSDRKVSNDAKNYQFNIDRFNYLTGKNKLTSANLSLCEKPTVACIDDSFQIIFLMEKIIRSFDYQFVGIKEPLQAIPKLISAKPDLIFLDLTMPGMNGYELCSQLRRITQFKNLPIVMLTNQDSILNLVKAEMVGCSQFITKPINVDKIKETIAKFIVTEKENQYVESR